MSDINEIFALPINLKPIPVFGTMRLFTSDSLKKAYIHAISKNKKTSSVVAPISKLIDNGFIIPCFLTKGIISTILFKMFPTDRARTDEQFFREEMRNVFGFYDSGSKKIYILISNHINKFGFANNDKLASITVHETIHMVANNKPLKFINYFNNILFDFYHKYFTLVFGLKGNYDKEIQNIILLLFNKFEKSKTFSNKNIKSYRSLIMDLKKYSTSEDFDDIVHDLIVTVTLFAKSTSLFIKNMSRYKHIIDPLNLAYKNTFGGIDDGNIPVQELLFPSEVIAIGSEIGNGKDIVNKIFALL